MSLKTLTSSILAVCLCASPSWGAPTIRKAISVNKTQPAKVVSGDGTKTAYVVLPPGFQNRPVVVAAGRFDLAKKYSDGLVKTVTPPKKRVPVQAFTADNP